MIKVYIFIINNIFVENPISSVFEESFEYIMFTLVFIMFFLLFTGAQESNNITGNVIRISGLAGVRTVGYTNGWNIAALIVFIILIFIFAVHLHREFRT